MFKESIKNKFYDGSFNLVSVKDIMRILGLKSGFDKKAIENALHELEDEGVLLKDASKRYTLPEKLGAIKGRIKGNERGFAFLLPENKELSDFFIPHRGLNGAMHGDIVFAVKTQSEGGSSDEARVIKIIERGYKSIVGTFFSQRRLSYVRPDDKNYFNDIFIPFKGVSTAKSGDKVLTLITSYGESGGNPEGVITEVLGRQFTKEAEEKSIIKSFGLADKFPQKALSEAVKAANAPLDLTNRQDLRGLLTFTIDGEDAKDLDDAVSIQKTQTGFVLGVHIADVSHYVKGGGELDKEALARATSVYFPESVIPMLPEALSNGACSLNAGEDKLTLSCIMQVDKSGSVTGSEIVSSVIRSSRRMTYTEVTNLIEGNQSGGGYGEIAGAVLNMKELAQILIEKRNARGSIDLDMKEAQISVDSSGEIDITERKRLIAHRIIEEFMILANETVAEYMHYLDMPFVYRVHEKPSEEKLTDFAAFVKELGLRVKWKNDSVHSKDFSDILAALENTPLFGLINKVMLRAMSKAKYSPDNIGHFGLSSNCYCHFTSPIRRYPDLLIHRIIKTVLDGQAPLAQEKYAHFVQEASKISSERERNADEAERAVDDLYKVRYMQKRIGEEYEGIISGVMGFGVFVELKNTVEGLIKTETLPSGRYEYDEKRFTLKSNRLSLKLGESVRIKVVAANPVTRKIEFAFIEKSVLTPG